MIFYIHVIKAYVTVETPLEIQLKLLDGLTVIPLKLYFNKRGMAKMQIALAKGKKLHDKRASIKEKDERIMILEYLVIISVKSEFIFFTQNK